MALPEPSTGAVEVESSDILLSEASAFPNLAESSEIKSVAHDTFDVLISEIKSDPSSIVTSDKALNVNKPETLVVETSEVPKEIKVNLVESETSDLELPEIKPDDLVTQASTVVHPEVESNHEVVDTCDVLTQEIDHVPIITETTKKVQDIRIDEAGIEEAKSITSQIESVQVVVETNDIDNEELKLKEVSKSDAQDGTANFVETSKMMLANIDDKMMLANIDDNTEIKTVTEVTETRNMDLSKIKLESEILGKNLCCFCKT